MRWFHLALLAPVSFGLVVSGCSSAAEQSTVQANKAPSVSTPVPSALPSPKTEKPLQAEQIDKTWSNEFKFETKSIEKKHEGNRGYEISVDYPQIERARAVSAKRFNRWIAKKVKGYVTEFTGLERSAEIHDRRKHLAAVGIDEGLEISYLPYYSNRRIISLRLTHRVMALGQMHPINYYETINYDLAEGRQLRPTDVFKAGYLRALSQLCRDNLKETYDLNYTTDDWVREGTTPTPDNFKNWNIVPDGILISFEDYQIAAHSFGQAELVIPYAALKNALRRNNVLNQFIRPSAV
jgi:hypothetical protein